MKSDKMLSSETQTEKKIQSYVSILLSQMLWIKCQIGDKWINAVNVAIPLNYSDKTECHKSGKPYFCFKIKSEDSNKWP